MKKTKEQIAGALFDEFSRWISNATPKELKWLSRQPLRETRNSECLAREIALRGAYHWRKPVGFCIAFLTMIFAAIAAWPIIHDWFRSPGKKNAQSESVLVPQINESPTPSLTPPVTTPPQ